MAYVAPISPFTRPREFFRLSGRSSGENSLDLGNHYAIDLGDLGHRHAVFDPGADARKVRRGDLRRSMRLGVHWSFKLLMTDRRRRRDCSQHTRFAQRLVGWRGVWN